MKALAYIRCSTEGQATEGVSLQTQAEHIRRYAAYKGFEIVEEIEDGGISGGVNKARPGFMKLLDRIEQGSIDAVILYSLERLSRDMLTLLALEKLIHECEIEIHCVDGQLDTSTPEGFMNFAMRAFMGEMERRTVKHRTRRAMQHKKGNGEVVGSIPFGFIREGDSLIPVVHEQAIIREVNQLHTEGQRLVDICRALNDQGKLTRAGKRWTPQQVKRLLTAYAPTFKKQTTKIGAAVRALLEAT